MQSNIEKSETRSLPMMPIRDVVIFPHMMTPFVVGRESSVRALEEALAGDKKIFLATQHDASIDDPSPDQIYQVGTIVTIVQSLKLPDGNIKVLVEGIERARAVSVNLERGFLFALVKTETFSVPANSEVEALTGRVNTLFEQYVKQSQNLNYETMIAAVRVDDAGKLADTIGAHLQLTIPEKQDLLEIFDPIERLSRIADVLDIEIEKLGVDRTIQGRVKRQMEKAQKEYYLNEKIKAIQKELGRGEKSEYDELRKKIEARRHDQGRPRKGDERDAASGKHAADVRRVHRLAQLHRLAAGGALEEEVARDPRPALRRQGAQRRPLRPGEDQRAHPRIPGRAPAGEKPARLDPVLRRTSRSRQDLARQVDRASATGRKFVRMSLGGVRDEAEIRGHRRTYIGALPGQIIQMMKKAGTRNPVVHARRDRQDVHRLPRRSVGGADGSARSRAEPHAFIDHYLDVEYDLSKVFFIATANVLHTHAAGADRPAGDHPPQRLHRARKGRNRQAPPGAQAARGARPEG